MFLFSYLALQDRGQYSQSYLVGKGCRSTPHPLHQKACPAVVFPSLARLCITAICRRLPCCWPLLPSHQSCGAHTGWSTTVPSWPWSPPVWFYPRAFSFAPLHTALLSWLIYTHTEPHPSSYDILHAWGLPEP